ncbi:glutathione S-transferase [Stella humosa]|uniref:Glutathione S-transferase n=1 Tax=Stella humosa TaxID=94 RepID=A0A3N1MGC7_9PROT|nr:glutathione S-transferase [Stella humosa]ROQ01807.1 glutathione S-transferase [Stella humosa]
MTAMARTLWGRRNSFNLQKVAWLLDELSLPHDHIEAGGAFGGLDAPSFRAMNPHGKVPVLRDGDVVLWESHTILRYLAASHGGPDLWPAAPGTRALADRWMDWSQATLQPAFMDLFWGWYRTPEPLRDAARIADAQRRCEDHYGLLDRELTGRPWLAGDRFTLADIPAGTSLYRWYEMDRPRPELPHLAAWYARLAARPAYRRHVMRPFGELWGRADY